MNSSLSLLAQSPLYLVGLSMSEHWAEDIERQWIVQLVFCIISTLGCSFIILSIILLKIKKVHYQYVACLAVSQLILTLNGLVVCILAKLGISIGKITFLCKLQSCLLTIGQKSGWIYISLISFNMIVLSRGHTDAFMRSKGVWIHTFSWVIINGAFIGGLWIHFGQPPSLPFDMCWTKEGGILFALYIPMGIFGVFNAGAITYIAVKYIVDFKRNREVRTNLLTTRSDSKVYYFLLRISFYPIIFLLVAMSMAWGRYLNYAHKAEGWTVYMIQVMFLEGFFCAIAYGFTPALRGKYAKLYRRVSATTTLTDTWNTSSCMSSPVI